MLHFRPTVLIFAGTALLLPVVAVAQAPKLKQGDHVEFSANGACPGEPFAIPMKGTILQVNLGTVMNYVIQVDPQPGASPRMITKPIYSQNCIRSLGDAAPQRAPETCPVDPPAPAFAKSAGPSDEVFKRVIYEQALEPEKNHADVLRVGMTFELFERGAPYANRLTGGGLRRDGSPHLLTHDGAPENATLYPIKIRYAKCIERPTWKRLWEIEENVDCFRNHHDEWACPVGGGATKFLKQIDLPK